MEYTMFNDHPHMQEVMALRNADKKMRACHAGLTSTETLSKGKLNLMAIDICSCYGNLLEFIYLCKQQEIPGDKTIQELVDFVLTEKNEMDALKASVLAKIPVVMRWENTQLPLPKINTNVKEVREVFEGLKVFYRWVAKTYLYTMKNCRVLAG